MRALKLILTIVFVLCWSSAHANEFAVREATVCANLVNASFEQQRLAHLILGISSFEGEHRDEVVAREMMKYGEFQSGMKGLETDSLIFLGANFFGGRVSGPEDSVHHRMIQIDNYVMTLKREGKLSEKQQDEASQAIDKAMHLANALRNYCAERYQSARSE